MIEIVGPEDTPERRAAERVGAALADLWPDLLKSKDDVVRIAANAKIYGYDIQDIDVVVIASFATEHTLQPLRPIKTNPNGEIVRKDIAVRSLAVAIELKSHDQRSVRFVGKSAQVRYSRGSGVTWHDATEQNIRQAHSLRAYLSDLGSKDIFVACLVMFENLDEADLPARPHAFIGSAFSGRGLLTAISEVAKPWKPPERRLAMMSAGRFDAIGRALQAPFFRKVEPSQLDRRRMDRLARRLGLQDDWFAALGKGQVVLRGRGGAGKTVVLLQMACRAFEESNARTLILTYNQALVADMRRTMALLGMPSNEADGGIRIDSAMAFLGRILRKLGVVSDDIGFVEQYVASCRQLADIFRSDGLPSDEVRELLLEDPERFQFDYLLVDEAQDWLLEEIAILRHCYPPEQFVIADGIDQLVRGTRIEWASGISPSKQLVINLPKCLRLKSNLAMFANALARQFNLPQWSVEPNSEVRGGRIVIVVGDYTRRTELDDTILKDAMALGNSPIDLLYCVPFGAQEGASDIAQWLKVRGRGCWDGVVADIRHDIPRSVSDSRIVTYDSCRGLEGWSVICIGIDEFWKRVYQRALAAHHIENPVLSQEQAAHRDAASWAMIPVTRAMDTLVISLSDPSSPIGIALRHVAAAHADFVEWIE